MPTIVERARTFETAYPRRVRALDGTDWTYHAGGHGPCVLLLTGGTGIGMAWMDLALALGPDRRLLAVDYPAIATFGGLADGLAALLDAEGVPTVDVVGQSMGGMLAEVFSRRTPERVRSLVLTGTGLYGEDDRERLRATRDGLVDRPWETVRESMRARLQAMWADGDEADFWVDRVAAATAGEAGRDRMVAWYDAFLDLIDRGPDAFGRPAWSGPTLMLRADDDTAITETHFARLREQHPDAGIRRYEVGGHSLLVTRPADYVAEVAGFLVEQDVGERHSGEWAIRE